MLKYHRFAKPKIDLLASLNSHLFIIIVRYFVHELQIEISLNCQFDKSLTAKMDFVLVLESIFDVRDVSSS